MKTDRVLAIAFVIGTSSLFASNLKQLDCNIDYKHPIETSEFLTTEKPDNSPNNSNVILENYTITIKNNIKLNNLNYNNKELFYKEIQLEAVKNYTYIMPDIIRKE